MSEKGPLSPKELSQDLNPNKSYKKESHMIAKCLRRKAQLENLGRMVPWYAVVATAIAFFGINQSIIA